MKKQILMLAFGFVSMTVKAQNEDSLFIRQMASEILSNAKAYDNLRVLTKTIGGRLAGSPQMVKAEQWGEKAMKEAGADNVWLQECMVPHWERGGKDLAWANSGSAKGSRKALDIIALGNSVGSMKPLQAPVLEVANFEEL